MHSKQQLINRITALDILIVEASSKRCPIGEWPSVTVAKRIVQEYQQQLNEMETDTNGNC